ncbi:uncharacterized protein LOC135373797 [Ornithodoros turicata]|uniref:uncharacterized protein LOC135373797 n=1 Tax=Ornithodoros turicata TaxID=34597 RepID=UPI0031395222
MECKTRRLKKGTVPSENLPQLSTYDARKAKRMQELQQQRQGRHLKRSRKENCTDVTPDDDAQNDYTFCGEEAHGVHNEQVHGCDTEVIIRDETQPADLVSVLKDIGIKEDKSIQVTSGEFGFKFTQLVNEKNVKSITGIGSMKLLDKLASLLEEELPTTGKNVLNWKDKVVMTMMVLKHTFPFHVLCHMFFVSPTTCSSAVKMTIRALSALLRCAVVWPSKEEVLENIPKCFKDFSQTRVILDCTEVSVGVPKCLRCRVNTYSHYKKGHTVKYMIGVSPGGLITFISKGYGGRASDKAIFEQSGLVKDLLPGIDSVMVDKGFLIDSICEEHLINVIRPPFLRQKKQFTKSEAMRTRKIAAARVHVERAIQRIKLFKILTHKLTWNMVPFADDVLLISAALTNLSRPIIGKDKFL